MNDRTPQQPRPFNPVEKLFLAIYFGLNIIGIILMFASEAH